ncbi:hypothetical protein E2C01_030413 [Portunus trituberculatus]|uniref:Transposase IS30-like HTH domain-containing protein n=1 Tax=Portunus trituberculatus TaxID=210409 RepID=A0A5B7EQS4_PORTR|nr:hypothetical protein [Portunus trituberculatus]
MDNSFLCYETCPCERLWFTWLWSTGASFRAIAKRSGRSPTTVRRWVRRLLGQYLPPNTLGRALNQMNACNSSSIQKTTNHRIYSPYVVCPNAYCCNTDFLEKCATEYMWEKIPISFERNTAETWPVSLQRYSLNLVAPCSGLSHVSTLTSG